MFEVVEVYLLVFRGIENHNWIAVLLGFAVLLLLLGFEVAQHAATKRDHELSQEISEWLLPHSPPSLKGIDVVFSSRMANHVGSDYYNVFPRWPRGQSRNSPMVFVTMADVAGTGLQGALLMATFQASLRVLADSGMALHDLASQMNQWSWDRSLEGRHFTMAFVADLDPDTGELSYVSAGHQPPVILRGSGDIERLDRAGFPLGALSDATYESGSTVMEKGDTLVIFSDGVATAENHRGELFSDDRVVRAIRTSRGLTASETLNELRNSILSFGGAIRQADDLSFVIVRKSP